jgi:hypothetical protein
MSLKFNKIVELTDNMFVITVILIIFVRYKHEILTKNYAKPNQKLAFVHYNREFAITVIVITEFDCNCFDRGTTCYFVCSRIKLSLN